MKIYIAGPMTGYPLYNFPAFDAAKKDLQSQGFAVISPADFDREKGNDPDDVPAGFDFSAFPPHLDLHDTIRLDIELLLGCDAIYMLEGWQTSLGASAEHAVAKWGGLELMYQNNVKSLNVSAKERKEIPVATGVIDYFPLALIEVAKCSKEGNDQHNPGQPLHWNRSKSKDESDAMIRHFMERGKTDSDGIRHSAKMAWRALAFLQKEMEAVLEEEKK